MTAPTPAELWTTWRDAAGDRAVHAAIVSLYEDLDRAVRDAPRDGPHGPPVCNVSGRCCRFDSFGHRLYVTGLEIAWFLTRVPGPGSGVTDERPDSLVAPSSLALPVIDETRDPAPGIRLEDACRYQIDGLCSTHTVRPMGCRVFFCTPGTDGWQQAVYERFMDRLRAMHKQYELPYHYMEWRTGLLEADRWLA